MILMTTHLVRNFTLSELLQWWSEFRENFASTKDWVNIIWNNKVIRVNDVPVFYKTTLKVEWSLCKICYNYFI